MKSDQLRDPGSEPTAAAAADLLAEIAADNAAWPGPPWIPVTMHGTNDTEWSQFRWNYEPSDRGPGCVVDLRHPGHSAELARYIARLREREPRLVATLQEAQAEVEAADERMAAILDGTFAVGDSTAQREIERLRAEVEYLNGCLRSRVEHAALRARGDADRIASLRSALAALIARVRRTGGYASPEEQDVLRAAELALAGGEPGQTAGGAEKPPGLPQERAEGVPAADTAGRPDEQASARSGGGR